MKLGHIGKYHDVFFKFDNGPYHTMLSGVMTLHYLPFVIKVFVLSIFEWPFSTGFTVSYLANGEISIHKL